MSSTESPPVAATATGAVPTTHPTGFYFFFWGEFAERCSYYGMRAILFLYLIDVLQFPRESATEIYNYFKASAYFLPLIGGIIADRYFGKYWTLVGFSVPYVLGHVVLGIEDRTALFVALFLLACGSGVTKPNISTLMGMTYDQKRPGQLALRSAAFLWFYFAVNVGATISMFCLPQIREFVKERTGNLALAYRIAFLFPTLIMAAALIIFAMGKRHYAVEVIDRTRKTAPEERRQQWQVLTKLFSIFAVMIFFWMAYEQNDNVWTLFARGHVDLTLDVGAFQYTFSPDQFQFVNGLFVMLTVPLIGQLWRRLEAGGWSVPPATRILIGLWWSAGAPAVMALAAWLASGGAPVSGWWMIAAYFVLTIGEVMVYGTGLELSYTAAPEKMKGFVTAVFLLTNTGGNLCNAQLAKIYDNPLPEPFRALYDQPITPHQFFTATAVVVMAASVLMYFVGRQFTAAQRSESKPS